MKLISKTSELIFTAYRNDKSKFLLHTGAIGWITSSAAQCTGIYFNDKFSKDRKDFLIKQEAADGAVNVALFYTISQAIKTGASKIVENGYRIPQITDEAIKSFGEKSRKIGRVEEFLNRKLIECTDIAAKEKIHAAIKELARYKNVFGIYAAYFSAFLACNILTPFLRNYIAQKWHNSQHHYTLGLFNSKH